MPRKEPKIEYTEQAKSDKGPIVLGLVLFVVLMLAGTFYNLINGQADARPKLVKPTNATECVKPTQWMRENHMKLLDDWRDEVVRDGNRATVVVDGKRYQKSLTHACLKCHTSKSRFCDQCHRWAGVTRPGVELQCWHCHIVPEVKPRAVTAPRAAQARR